MNLFALCKKNGEYNIKRIPLEKTIQKEIEEIFLDQANIFMTSYTSVCEFTGSWKSEDDELFYLKSPGYIDKLFNTVISNNSTLDLLHIEEYDQNPIKALFTYDDKKKEVLVQRFVKTQILGRKYALFLDKNIYNKIDQPAITLDSKLLCIISNGTMFFNNFSNMRMSFDMKEFYVEATNIEIESYFKNNSNKILINDISYFTQHANQTIRKLINNLNKSSVLSDFSIDEIKNKASEINLNILQIENDKIVLPNDKNEIVKILSFLDEKLYKGTFSNNTFITNSTRKIED